MLLLTKSNAETGIVTFYSNLNNACQYDPSLYENFLKVAISGTQWNNSISCGTCLNIQGIGTGIGTIPFLLNTKAIVTNLCSECEYGHYDLLLDGNGIWDINYEVTQCDDLGSLKYRSDSELYFFKVQFINTKTPITSFYLDGRLCEKTFDNFWVHHDPTQLGGDIFTFPLNVNFVTQDGSEYYGTIYDNKFYTDFFG
jgi:hypothetical protein